MLVLALVQTHRHEMMLHTHAPREHLHAGNEKDKECIGVWGYQNVRHPISAACAKLPVVQLTHLHSRGWPKAPLAVFAVRQPHPDCGAARGARLRLWRQRCCLLLPARCNASCCLQPPLLCCFLLSPAGHNTAVTVHAAQTDFLLIDCRACCRARIEQPCACSITWPSARPAFPHLPASGRFMHCLCAAWYAPLGISKFAQDQFCCLRTSNTHLHAHPLPLQHACKQADRRTQSRCSVHATAHHLAAPLEVCSPITPQHFYCWPRRHGST